MKVILPEPDLQGRLSLEQCLYGRRCRRNFSHQRLALPEIGQLAWAAQGISSAKVYRTCPSAGALYPLELLVIAGDVQGLDTGVYRYDPHDHALALSLPGDLRPALSDAGLRQASIRQAPASLLLTAVFEKTTGKYGERGIRYIFMEAGHAAQNVCLQATALGLGTVMIGAFQDDRVNQVLHLAIDETPLYILPVGR